MASIIELHVWQFVTGLAETSARDEVMRGDTEMN